MDFVNREMRAIGTTKINMTFMTELGGGNLCSPQRPIIKWERLEKKRKVGNNLLLTCECLVFGVLR